VICAATGRKLLRDEVVASDVSGRLVDTEVARRSAVSGRIALPVEILACEETGAAVLPDETEVCELTGKRVDRRLLGNSEIHPERRGLSRLLQVCPETGHRAFADEMDVCDATGLCVDPAVTDVCMITGAKVLRRLLIPCEATDRLIRRDKAISSEQSGRKGHPDTIRTCLWTGIRLLSDEVRQCPVTNNTFCAELVPGPWPASPLVDLLQSGVPATLGKSPIDHALTGILGASGNKPRAMRVVISDKQPVAAFLADCSTLFGFKKRQVIGFASIGDPAMILGQLGSGRLDGNDWVQDSI
jgi:hypothetical protein